MKKKRYIPMPTEADKVRARLKMASADPLVWAMKSVDDKFPDERVKTPQTIRAEAEAEKKFGPSSELINEADIPVDAAAEISAEVAAEVPVNASAATAAEVGLAEEELDKESELLGGDELLDEYDEDLLDDEENDDMLNESDLLHEPEVMDESELLNNSKMIDELSKAKRSRWRRKKDAKKELPKVLEGLETEMAAEKAEREAAAGNAVSGAVEAGGAGAASGDVVGASAGVAKVAAGSAVAGNIADGVEPGTRVKMVRGRAKAATAEAQAGASARVAKNVTNAGSAVNGATEAGGAGETGDEKAPVEIKAEDKLVMPMGNGAMTMEVTPMRQDVSNVSPDEVKAKRKTAEEPEEEAATEETGEQAKAINNVADNGQSAVDGKLQVKLTSLESKQKKLMFGAIGLAVLAVAGVLFGVVATIRQGKATEELANQIAVTQAAPENNVDEDNIYVRDWGIKIKIVTGLSNVSYNMMMDDYSEVQIWGTKKDAGANYVPDFAKQIKNSSPLGTVVRVPRYERAAAGRLIWYDDYYNYYYQGPSGVPAVSEDEMSWWVESYLLIKEMLTNADNYTSIEDSTIGQQ